MAFFVCIAASALSSHEQRRDFQVFNAANGLADNSIQRITCTHTGRMIISTIGNLNFYDGAGFTHIDTRSDYQIPLSEYSYNSRLLFDRRKHLWVKDAHSVACVDLAMEQFVPDPERVIREMGCSDPILDIFVDGIGGTWFLTEKGLFDVKTQKTLSIPNGLHLQDLVPCEKMLLTFYDNGEELGLDRETGKILHRTKSYEGSKEFNKSSVFLRVDSLCYMVRNSEKEGIMMSFDLATLSWKEIMQVPYHLNDLAVFQEHLYIASQYGYWTYHLETGKMVHYNQISMIGGKLSESNCNAICFDKQGGMWIGTQRRGVLYSRPRMAPFVVYSFDNPKAWEYRAMMDHLQQNDTVVMGMKTNCILTDSRQWTWYGTTSGLYAYRKPDAKPLVFNKKNGLLNNVINAIVEDKNHNIWLSTSYGISCVMIENGKPVFVNSFNSYDNVPVESFTNGKAMCLDDGTIIMESVDHITTFNPDSFTLVNHRQHIKLDVKLIRLLVNGNFIEGGQEVDGNMIIDCAISRAKDIWLNSNQNTITLTFSGLNYFRPLQTCYRVRVKGIDDVWRVYSYFNGTGLVDSRGLLHLPMVGLKPGDYEVEIQASVFPDVWDGCNTFSWTVHVSQPWWQATGVYVLLLLVIAVLVFYNLVIFNRNTRMKAHLNAEESSIIKNINSFVERCKSYDNELLAPTDDELFGRKVELSLSPEFLELMVKLMPYLLKNQRVTMHKLTEVAQMDVVPLYHLLATNIYKSPRQLIMLLRLRKAASLLKTTNKRVEDISVECQFYTPNYFIGNFFHLYKKTPGEYRNS